jgi:5-formyltetrahydrofolate cyclo-ligase
MPTTPLDLEKRALRAQLRARVAEAAATDARAAAEAAAEAVVSSSAFRAAQRVALYAAFGDELPTRPLFDVIVDSGKEALFPRCVGNSLEFARVDRWTDLVPGAYGTHEPPASSLAQQVVPGDLVMVPGLGFDLAGGRLGRGRGHYDRAFAAAAVPFLCGLAYAAQIVERVPMGPYDVQMNAVATENGWSFAETAVANKPGGA